MKFTFFRTVVLISLLTNFGCANLGTIVDQKEAKKVKKVAILGFSIYRTSGEGPTVGFGNKKLTTAQKNRKVQYEILEDLRKNIEEKTGWSVLSLEDLKKSKTYLEIYKKKSYRPRMVDVTFKGVENLMDYHTASFLASRPEKMKAVANELGIDAYILFSENLLVATAAVNVQGKRVKVINDNFSAQVFSSLRVSNIETGKVIYQIQNVEGEEIFNDNFEEDVSFRAKEDVLNLRASRAAMGKLFSLIK